VPAQASSASGTGPPSASRSSTSTRSWWAPSSSVRATLRAARPPLPSACGRASAAPARRIVTSPGPARPDAVLAAVQASGRARPEVGARVEDDAHAGAAVERQDPPQDDGAALARRAAPGASRHSTTAVVQHPAAVPDQRALLVEARPTRTGPPGSPANWPLPPMSEEKIAGLSHRGKHMKAKSPCGPTSTPRSPSASSAYSRRTAGGVPVRACPRPAPVRWAPAHRAAPGQAPRQRRPRRRWRPRPPGGASSATPGG
jgi:FAD/FMN-containing dehydrogenase